MDDLIWGYLNFVLSADEATFSNFKEQFFKTFKKTVEKFALKYLDKTENKRVADKIKSYSEVEVTNEESSYRLKLIQNFLYKNTAYTAVVQNLSTKFGLDLNEDDIIKVATIMDIVVATEKILRAELLTESRKNFEKIINDQQEKINNLLKEIFKNQRVELHNADVLTMRGAHGASRSWHIDDAERHDQFDPAMNFQLFRDGKPYGFERNFFTAIFNGKLWYTQDRNELEYSDNNRQDVDGFRASPLYARLTHHFNPENLDVLPGERWHRTDKQVPFSLYLQQRYGFANSSKYGLQTPAVKKMLKNLVHLLDDLETKKDTLIGPTKRPIYDEIIERVAIIHGGDQDCDTKVREIILTICREITTGYNKELGLQADSDINSLEDVKNYVLSEFKKGVFESATSAWTNKNTPEYTAVGSEIAQALRNKLCKYFGFNERVYPNDKNHYAHGFEPKFDDMFGFLSQNINLSNICSEFAETISMIPETENLKGENPREKIREELMRQSLTEGFSLSDFIKILNHEKISLMIQNLRRTLKETGISNDDLDGLTYSAIESYIEVTGNTLVDSLIEFIQKDDGYYGEKDDDIRALKAWKGNPSLKSNILRNCFAYVSTTSGMSENLKECNNIFRVGNKKCDEFYSALWLRDNGIITL